MFNFSQFLADNMHEQKMNITTEGMFNYESALVYMSLFMQQDKFPINLHKQDDQGINQSVILWTSLVKKNSTEFKFSDFIDSFVHTVVGLLINQSEPRISSEIKRVLHLSEKTKTRDRYLCQNYTKISVYGCELAPYKLPRYVPMRIFSLEYKRQMINMDETHFS